MTRYGMAIDLRRCIGCQACAAACKVANNNPKDVAYNIVYTKPDRDWEGSFGTAVVKGALANDNAGGTFPNCTMVFLPVQCQHCENPACEAACPTGATSKDPETGIVSVDSELCIGCESCIKACPYENVRTLVKSPEYYLDVVVGEHDAPPHVAGTVEKCTFCKNLIDRGEVPACMQLCPGRARYWGDLDDPSSDVSKAIQGRDTVFLMESAGTQPNVYYLQ
ncbi:4Fe-4S dicluster domain-containing protein [Adlercreutzia aquisgranensis]|uniref:4Fe-4S dicluster domain-containing protein n=1 Tax=Muribaculaceae bacterium Z82 TaxID=2304548 RepID=A0A7C9NAJ3_9BACT|nr:4Fe-4S dicluster domain-containing protein [Adlercreutzia aquisgranensis]